MKLGVSGRPDYHSETVQLLPNETDRKMHYDKQESLFMFILFLTIFSMKQWDFEKKKNQKIHVYKYMHFVQVSKVFVLFLLLKQLL